MDFHWGLMLLKVFGSRFPLIFYSFPLGFDDFEGLWKQISIGICVVCVCVAGVCWCFAGVCFHPLSPERNSQFFGRSGPGTRFFVCASLLQ